MIYKTPRETPTYTALWWRLGKPHPTSVAKALGVEVRTVYRWMATDQVPKPAALALHWMTPEGKHELWCDLVNEADIHLAMCHALRRELAHLAADLCRAQALASFHARHAPQAANAAALHALHGPDAAARLAALALPSMPSTAPRG